MKLIHVARADDLLRVLHPEERHPPTSTQPPDRPHRHYSSANTSNAPFCTNTTGTQRGRPTIISGSHDDTTFTASKFYTAYICLDIEYILFCTAVPGSDCRIAPGWNNIAFFLFFFVPRFLFKSVSQFQHSDIPGGCMSCLFYPQWDSMRHRIVYRPNLMAMPYLVSRCCEHCASISLGCTLCTLVCWKSTGRKHGLSEEHTHHHEKRAK